MTGSSFSQFSDELSHRFLYNSDYKLKYNKDKLIMLVGSSSVYPDFKFVAVGVLNGKAQVNAKANDQIQYPQAWYDKTINQILTDFQSDGIPRFIPILRKRKPPCFLQGIIDN